MIIKIFNGFKFRQQFERRLLAHPFDSGDIIRSIAHQPLQIDDLPGLQAIDFLQVRLIKNLDFAHAFARQQHFGRLRDELERIPVSRNAIRLNPRLICTLCDCANHVICFIALNLQNRDIQLVQSLLDERKLAQQFIRRFLPVAFIIIEQLFAESRPL